MPWQAKQGNPWGGSMPWTAWPWRLVAAGSFVALLSLLASPLLAGLPGSLESNTDRSQPPPWPTYRAGLALVDSILRL